MRTFHMFLGCLLLMACSTQPPSPSPSPSPNVTTVSPAAPSYALDCGPLDQVTCEERAAAAAAETLADGPSRRITSISFGKDCGSYVVTFDYGTYSGADASCIQPD
jgi:hypothetical protein